MPGTSRFRSIHLVCTLAVTGGLLGCGPSGTVPDAEDEMVESLYIEPLGLGVSAAIQDTTALVFRTAEDWEGFRDNLRPRGPFKESDFEQTMILVAAVPAPTGGYTVEFESVEIIGDEIVASYVVSAPGYDCVAISALTQPFQVVAVRQVEGNVRFVHRTETESCET